MIGKACTQVLAKDDTQLMLMGRDKKNLETLAGELKTKVELCVVDVTSELDVTSAVDRTMRTYGRVDAVMQNIAIYPWKRIEDLSLQEWQETLNINMTGSFLLTKAFFSVMKKQKSGSIVFSSSIAGEIIGLPHMSAYAASKAGLNGFMRTSALEFAPYNINVNCISPGRIYNPSTLTEDEMREKLAPIPLKRFIDPEDIAHMFQFLISDRAKNITGQNFIIDGGQSIIGDHSHTKAL